LSYLSTIAAALVHLNLTAFGGCPTIDFDGFGRRALAKL
jgi:hypothetical protein